MSAVNTAYADNPPAVSAEGPHVDAGVRVFFAKPQALDGLSSAVGFPNTGGTFLLYGGGATLVPGALRLQISGWTGGLQVSAGDRTTDWELSMAALNLEQRYLAGSFELTGGAGLDYGQFHGSLDDGQINRLESNLWGYAATVGVRWPAQSQLGFFVRGGYEWLQGDGVWHGGAVAAHLGGTHLDLGGPSLTGQLELSFQ